VAIDFKTYIKGEKDYIITLLFFNQETKKNIISIRNQTTSLQDIHPKRNNKYIPSFNDILKERFYLFISILF
jgi:hypothetical protein